MDGELLLPPAARLQGFPDNLKMSTPRQGTAGWIAGSAVSSEGNALAPAASGLARLGQPGKKITATALNRWVVVNLHDSKHLSRSLKCS